MTITSTRTARSYSVRQRLSRTRAALSVFVTDLTARLIVRMGPVDERGGGRNTDEGFHIAGGAVVAGVIATAVGAFVAKKLGALE